MDNEQVQPQVQLLSPSKISHKVVLGLIILLTIIGLILIFQGNSSLKTRQGQLVGVATADGTIRYGELALADSQAVILRNVFVSRGFTTFPEEEELGPSPTPFYQVDPESGSGMYMDSEEASTVVIPRNQVLFMSSDVADFAAKAVRSWTPTPSPTPPPPPPTPKTTPVPVEGGEEVEAEPEEPLAPEGTLIPTPATTEMATPTPMESPGATAQQP